MPRRRLWNALAALSGLCLAVAGAAAAAPAASTAAGKTDDCPDGLEALLPGDYYACRAKYHLDRDHPARALSMLKEAAYWANKNAQYFLGLSYFDGDVPGIPANRPLGIAWLALAAERRNPDFVRAYTQAAMRATPAELRQAGALYQQLLARYGDKVAGPRAQRRFERGIRPMEEAAQSGGIVYLSGYAPLPQSADTVVRQLHAQADRDFADLHGRVVVGALQDGATPAAAASAPAGGR